MQNLGKDGDLKISVVIPAYNTEGAIGNVLKRIKELNRGYEVIVIDDGSKDNTREIAMKMGAKTLFHNKNMGYGASIKSGIENATNEWILTMDSDGQHDIKEADKLIRRCSGYDMVVGSRPGIFNTKLWRVPGKLVLRWLSNYLVDYKIPDLNSGFRLFRKNAVKEYLHLCSSGFSFTTTVTLAMLSSGKEICYVPVRVKKTGGKSEVTIHTGLSTLILILRICMLFNPLKIFLPISVFLAFLAFLWFIWDISIGDPTTGSFFCATISMFTFFFGLLSDQIASIRKEMR
ncbi:MAG: glycosyltransferase family 2 protein [Candidatus Omnitrophica bacterium]|nr:glycosyltransferase family 2 protein [Candidatus Omnitrophota bacterium]